KRLRGVIKFVQDCAANNSPRLYDFDRLRRKLGLAAGETTAAAAAPTAGATDVSAMGAGELAALDPEQLADATLEQAFRTALQLAARELAGKSAHTLVGRPANAAAPDRWPAYQLLIQQAQSEGNYDVALGYIDAGEKADCEANEGRRRNDYEMRRG